jgi:hypothetical protein
MLEAMSPNAREDYFLLRERPPAGAAGAKIDWALQWKHDVDLEHTFVAAGGLLPAGPDPTGAGDVLPGFGDQREIELLVEAGFSPVEAIKVATSQWRGLRPESSRNRYAPMKRVSPGCHLLGVHRALLSAGRDHLQHRPRADCCSQGGLLVLAYHVRRAKRRSECGKSTPRASHQTIPKTVATPRAGQ